MATSLVPRSRRAVLAALTATLLAVPAAYAAPRAPYPPPNHPAPIAEPAPAAARALTLADREPASALAQERYYGSFGASGAASAPTGAAADTEPERGGVPAASLILLVATALAVGLAAWLRMPRRTGHAPASLRQGAVR